jgi:16S rRNA (adenine1518-N6/adenine1519-N6)-dimethyltransferase
MDLSGGSFWPQPNVDSRAVGLVGRNDWPGCANPKVFQGLLRALFSSRRKTVHNNLKAWLSAQGPHAIMGRAPTVDGILETDGLLTSVGIDPGARAETLPLERFLRLSDAVAGLWA